MFLCFDACSPLDTGNVILGNQYFSKKMLYITPNFNAGSDQHGSGRQQKTITVKDLDLSGCCLDMASVDVMNYSRMNASCFHSFGS